MIYGATGHTGRLMARMARARGHRPVLSGRDAFRLRGVAEPLGLEARPAHLGETGRLVESLRDVEVLLNVAGPFVSTWRPLAEACLRTGTHYLDVSGELPVFESLHGWDPRARRHGVLLAPGVGFFVVASDGLAAHVARRLPDARTLRLGLSRSCFVSPGTVRTVVSLASRRTRICQGGELVAPPLGSRRHRFDFGDGEETAVALPFPDVLTAHLTTGIPNVEICLQASLAERWLWQSGRFFGGLLRTAPGRALAEAQLGRLPRIPTEAELAGHHQVLVAEAEGLPGRRAVARLLTPESYTFTCAAALAVVERVLAGDFTTGFRTPSQLYGADFVLTLPGVLREDLEGGA